jgi:hypothetical protein
MSVRPGEDSSDEPCADYSGLPAPSPLGDGLEFEIDLFVQVIGEIGKTEISHGNSGVLGGVDEPTFKLRAENDNSVHAFRIVQLADAVLIGKLRQLVNL